MHTNGYFQLASTNEGLMITVYPPQSGGRKAEIEDLILYATQKGISDYIDVLKAKIAFDGGKDKVKMLIYDKAPMPNGEFGSYNISRDKMQVEAVFYPPFEGAQQLTADGIKDDLAAAGVKMGILDDEINRFIQEREYFVPYVVARGQQPVDGHDGRIEYKFNTVTSAKPKMNADGTVDFHSLDNVNHINAGDVVAELFPEDYGTPGYDVAGQQVSPKKVKRAVFQYGRNLKVSEDKRFLIS